MTESSHTGPSGIVAPFRGEDPFYDQGQEGLDLRTLADILLRGKWVVLAAVLAVAIPVGLYSVVSPSMYRAYAILLVDRTNQDLASVLPDAGQLSPFLRDRRNLSNEYLVLDQSMPLALTVAEKLIEIGTVPGTDKPLSILYETAEGEPTTLDVAFRLQGAYVDPAQSDGDADALRVIAVSTDPREAALIANEFAAAFADLTQDQSRSGAAASREFLEGQVDEQSQRLSETDEAVESYMLREGAVALEEGTASIVQRIAALDAQRDQAEVSLQTKRAELGALQTELNRLEGGLEARLASNLDDELAAARVQVQTLREQLETIYTRNEGLRADPSPSDPNVVRLRRALERAEAEQRRIAGQLAAQSLSTGSGPNDQNSGFTRAAELRAQIAQARVEVSGLEAQLRQVSRSLGEYEAELAAIPAQSIELAQLQRQRLAAERLYGALEQNLQQARVAEQSQLGYARVIRPAYPPDAPFSPLRARNILLSIVLGLGLGIALAVAKVRLDHRLHTPEDLAHVGVPLMGTIPSTTEIVEEEHGGAPSVEVNGRMVDTHIVSLLSPMATASESYRALRTNLQFSRPDKIVQTVLVTSSNPSEGKSVTASNLAVVFAQAGRRVLLVDADLRRPTVHKKLGISREPGLVQELFGQGGIDPTQLHQLADDLYVLPAGSLAPNPSELIGSRRMRDVIDDMRSKFDLIIFDAPPVLAATDAVLLSTQCDATLMITRAGQTKDYEVQSALTALSDVGTKVSGIVLNAFDVRQAYGYRYKYAYRYGAAYSYGHEASNAPADA